MFFGQPGSGVLPMARAFAQFLNCENPQAEDSCGACGSCRRATKMEHPDIHFVYPIVKGAGIKDPTSVDYIREWRKLFVDNPYASLNNWVDFISTGDAKNKQGIIPTEEAQKIIHKINLKAFEGKFKVIIIWMPEKMHPNAANALLKSLEEPTQDTLFILASEARDQLLSTIVSRTQLVKLQLLQEEEVAERIMNDYEMGRAEALDIARLADGNFADAMEMAEHDKGSGSHEEAFINWMRLCFSPLKTMDKLLSWVDGMAAENKEHQKQFLGASLRVLRECLIVNLADGPLVKLEATQRVAIQKFLPFVNVNNIDAFSTELSEASYHLERNASTKILFLDLSLKISRILQIK
ncbi:MAG: DNA polymerase III subunit delta [Bacteroidetes bacterium]|nr:DNA polymerase III subunit delta [Bacteroidota bacterium]